MKPFLVHAEPGGWARRLDVERLCVKKEKSPEVNLKEQRRSRRKLRRAISPLPTALPGA